MEKVNERYSSDVYVQLLSLTVRTLKKKIPKNLRKSNSSCEVEENLLILSKHFLASLEEIITSD
jgi:hypothetical protein